MSTAVRRNVIISPSDCLLSLKLDPVYSAKLDNAGPDAMTNWQFTGEFADVDGHCISEYVALDHDGFGPIGSPFNPRAKLGGAIPAATTTVVTIFGGGSAVAGALTKPLYFKWFPGYAYEFIDGTTVAPGAGPFYALVINPPNAAVDPSKVGMFSYTTGNNGNQIATVNRLAGTASGQNVTVLGGVNWVSAPWAGNVTAEYAIGATILPCNAKGVPFGYSAMFLANALYRGYGKYRAKRGNEGKEDSFVREIFIKSVFGQTPVRDAALRIPGIAVLQHAVKYPDLAIPVVTS